MISLILTIVLAAIVVVGCSSMFFRSWDHLIDDCTTKTQYALRFAELLAVSFVIAFCVEYIVQASIVAYTYW